jgi:DNA helicase II / ATP-dependent DNA helicase PcrA
VGGQRRQTRAGDVFDLGALNPSQREAVLHEAGPLLVLAGAGSGKTRVIIFRIARLLRDGVPAERILGVTFTNKAAREMRERLVALAGSQGRKVQLSTFHALGLSILKAEPRAAGLRPSFCIYDTSDQLSLVRELMRQVKVADRRLDAPRVLELILKTKRERRAEVAIDWGDDYELAAYDLYPRYCEQMRAFNAIDFDDLILRAQDVLNEPEVRRRWSEKFEHILVDEYQDTSPDQLELVRVLAGAARNICVVGDDDQSIYAWRGASAGNILLFGEHFKGAREVILDQNYRSTCNILAAANAVIANNKVRKVKRLWSALGTGDPVAVVACADEEDEANFVAETVGKLAYQGTSYDDIAVLYRSNIQSRIFEETFALERVPFRVVGGQAFFDRKEVRDAMAYLALAHNPHDEIALRRIINTPPRGIGPASLERLVRHAEEHKKSLWWALQEAGGVADLPRAAAIGVGEFVRLLAPAVERAQQLGASDLEPWARELFDSLRLRDAVLASDDAPALSQKRLENLDEVMRELGRFADRTGPNETPLASFLRNSALVRGPEEDEETRSGQVTLMTLHSAKGLEFPYVFMVGVEEELLPHKKTVDEGGDLSEERRLCYVGITRARRQLWLTYARARPRHGKLTERSPSRFLQELPDGDGVKRCSRDAPPADEAQADAAANEFFKRMRAQLGIDD